MSYIIVSGYYDGIIQDGMDKNNSFYPIWHDNTLKYSDPEKIYIINSGKNTENLHYLETITEWINVKKQKHLGMMTQQDQLTGWSQAVLLGCLLAYHNDCDMIFKEQDCIAWGNWVEYLYEEMGNYQMIMGKTNGEPVAGLMEQSLFIIKYNYLLSFVKEYLDIVESDKSYLPEDKFVNILRKDPKNIIQSKLPYGRTKPINPIGDIGYAQQLTAEEMELLKDVI